MHQTGHVDHTGHEFMFRDRFWVCLILAVPVLLYSPTIQGWLGFSMPTFPGSQWVSPLLAVIIFLYGGVPFLQMAWPELQMGQPGMMTLISLAISVAFIYSVFTVFTPIGDGFFWELVTLIVVMLLGHWLEMRSVRQASGALDELAKLMPDTAERITPDGNVETIKLSDLNPNDKILVRPGASVPADGEVFEGQSEVNEAMITGESKPVKKTVGDKVIAGTVNGDGSLRVQITATGDETALAGIVRLVREAQASKSDIRRLHEMGIEVAMLTGDSRAVAKAVAEELEIDTYFAEVLPEDKDQKVSELQAQQKKVAMVGDGVNDAPALTRADIGIAIGSGTDVAVESAGIILVQSNPLDVVKIVELSRASYRKMIENLIWATGYNIVALPLAAGVLAPIGFILSPAIGALAMSLSTVIVAINAQLLRNVQIGVK